MLIKHLFLEPAAEGSPSAPPAPAPAPADKKADAPADSILKSTPAPDPAKTPAPPEVKPGDATAKPDEKKDGEPAKVEPIDIKLPDGFSADPALLDEFKKLASETGLKSEVAQKLVDFQAKIHAAMLDQQKKAEAEFNAQEAAWRTEAAKIPAAELGLAKRAMLHFTKGLPDALRDETRSVLESTWMGNHPGVLRVLAAAGAFVAEDHLAEDGTSGHAPSGPATPAEMFPSLSKNKKA